MIATAVPWRPMMPRTDTTAKRGRRVSGAASADVDIGVRVLTPAWRRCRPQIRHSVRRATLAALEHVKAGFAGGRPGSAEVTIVLTDDAEVRRLNREYRGIDKPTNVLSFGDDRTGHGHAPGMPIMLGDVVLAYETIAAEATAQGKTLSEHANHLVVHGVLHLLGHDHRTSRDACAMEAIETDVLAGLGIADPYRVRLSIPMPVKKSRSRR